MIYDNARYKTHKAYSNTFFAYGYCKKNQFKLYFNKQHKGISSPSLVLSPDIKYEVDTVGYLESSLFDSST